MTLSLTMMQVAGVGFTLLGIAVDLLPLFFARCCVESNDRRVGETHDQGVAGDLRTAVDGVTAHHGDDRRILLGLVLPEDLGLNGVLEAELEDLVRECRVQVQILADHRSANLRDREERRSRTARQPSGP